jgi:PAS domain S-box-containing protein
MTDMEAQLFQSFSDAMPFGVCLVDLQGKIIYWNAAAEGITGYLRHEVLGRAYRGDLLIRCEGASASTETQCPVVEVLRDGRAVAASLSLRHKDGHRTPIHVYAFPLRDSMGEMLGVGEIFDPPQGKQEGAEWVRHTDREFEMATGLPSVEESREQLHALLRSRAAPSSVLMLIEMSEQQAILQHGGAPMLHQAIRVLAKTVAGLLPPRHYVGCWTDWRLIAIVPECGAEALETLQATLAGVGSACAVKWWGDRVVVGMRAAARHVDSSQTADELIRALEQELKNAGGGKE